MEDLEKPFENFIQEITDQAYHLAWYRWERNCWAGIYSRPAVGYEKFFIGFKTISPKNLLTFNLRLIFEAPRGTTEFDLNFPHQFELSLEDEMRRNPQLGKWVLIGWADSDNPEYEKLMKLYVLLSQIHERKRLENGAMQIESITKSMATFL